MLQMLKQGITRLYCRIKVELILVLVIPHQFSLFFQDPLEHKVTVEVGATRVRLLVEDRF